MYYKKMPLVFTKGYFLLEGHTVTDVGWGACPSLLYPGFTPMPKPDKPLQHVVITCVSHDPLVFGNQSTKPWPPPKE